MNMVHLNDPLRKINLGTIFLCLSLIISCNSPQKIGGLDSNDSQIQLNYLARLEKRDKSLLDEINSLTGNDIDIKGWKGQQNGQRGFYLQITNLSDRIIFLNRPGYSVFSNIYKKSNKDWIDISVEVRPSAVLPYVLKPNQKLELFFNCDLPENVNIQGDINMPKYTNIADKGLLQYSEVRVIKRFTIE